MKTFPGGWVQSWILLSWTTLSSLIIVCLAARSETRSGRDRSGMSLWIDRKEIERLTGFSTDIFIVSNGVVAPYLTDLHIMKWQLPILPPDVSRIELTWMSPGEKNFYWFSLLSSQDPDLLYDPLLSIYEKGWIPSMPRGFNVSLSCQTNASGIGSIYIALNLSNSYGIVDGFPLTLSLRKRCETYAAGNCVMRCANGGSCTKKNRCACTTGYSGKYCQKPICRRWCGVHGRCIEANSCQCRRGWRGRLCNKTFSKPILKIDSTTNKNNNNNNIDKRTNRMLKRTKGSRRSKDGRKKGRKKKDETRDQPRTVD